MKARCHRSMKGHPYTRKKYIRGFPQPRIVKFTMGNTTGSFEYQVSLVAQKEAQVLHGALEAARMAVNRRLSSELGEEYCLRILPYPHQVLRENKMLNVAQADRFQDGMSRPFGKPIGTAARVKTNQTILTMDVNEGGLEAAREAAKLGKAKLPMVCRIKIEKVMD